jgi:hypothetical protein
MKENYELIDNEERHQYEFHIERYVPRIEYIKNKDGVIYLIWLVRLSWKTIRRCLWDR